MANNTKETVSDIVGKGLEYVERTVLNVLKNQQIGTVPVGVGVANWGPVGIETQITNFENVFGTPITREHAAKDYTGLTLSQTLKITPRAYFTRIASSDAQYATHVINKNAKPGMVNGAVQITGANYALSDVENKFGISVKNELGITPHVITIDPSLSATIDSGMMLTNFDVFTDNLSGMPSFNAGDFIKFEVDGQLLQYIIVENDLFTRIGDNTVGNLYKTENGGVGSATPGFAGVTFNTTFANNAAASTPTGISDTREKVVFVSQQDIVLNDINNALSESVVSFRIGFTLDDGPNPAAHTFSSKTIVLPVATYTNITELKDALQAELASKWGSWGNENNGILQDEAFPLEVLVVGTNRISIGTKAIGSHAITISDEDCIDTNKVSLAHLLKLHANFNGVAPGLAVTIQGQTAPIYSAIFESTINGVTQTTNINFPFYESQYFQQIFDKIASGLSGKNATPMWVYNGSSIVGIRIVTNTKGVGNSISFQGSISGGKRSLFSNAAATAPHGIKVTQAVTSDGIITFSSNDQKTGTDGDGNINTFVDRLAIAIKKHLLNGITQANGNIISSSMSLSECEIIKVREEGNKATIDFYSQRIGAQSILKIFNFPILFPTASYSSIVSAGKNKTISAIVQELNSKLTSKNISCALGSDGKLIMKTNSSGANYGFIIHDENHSTQASSVKLLKILGIKDVTSQYDLTNMLYSGANGKLNLGSFVAAYTGSEGNTIKIVKKSSQDGVELQVYFRNALIDSFYRYSNVLAATNYLGTLIANSSKVNKIVQFFAPEGVTELDDFEDGVYQLAGGTSGIEEVEDTDYVFALENYKNTRLYKFDIIVVTAMSAPIVIDKIEEVCSYRKDCFGFVDPPEVVAGLIGGRRLGGAEDMIRWHNGNRVIDDQNNLSKKLESKYLVTYFPWVLINTPSTKIPKQWHAPSSVVLPTICYVDAIAGNTVTPPAGKRAKLTSVEDIAYYLRDEDVKRMYDDRIGNNINNILFSIEDGFTIDGQKTCHRGLDKYNRIHIMRVGLFLKRKIAEIAPNFFFLPVTKNTRDDFKSAIVEEAMKPLVEFFGIQDDYEVFVDEINTPEIEAEQGMIAKIEWKPVGAVEKIKVISVMYDDVVEVNF